MINDLLKQLGFGDKEILIYLTLLQHGKLTPSSLAKIVNLNRSTVYSIAKDLAAKGIIAEDFRGKQHAFSGQAGARPVIAGSKRRKTAGRETGHYKKRRGRTRRSLPSRHNIPFQKLFLSPRIRLMTIYTLKPPFGTKALWNTAARPGDFRTTPL